MRISIWVLVCLVCPVAFLGADLAHSEPPESQGSLIVVGGGAGPDEALKRFVELAGSKDARLVVIPTAANEFDHDGILQNWAKRGITNCTVLHTRDREEADSDAFVKPLKDASAVWFSGGLQSRIADAYVGTAVEREVLNVLSRGGVIGGTSAGAAIQSRVMIASKYPVPEIRQGMDLVPDSIVDQHFLKRNRMNRLLYAVRKNPDLLGIGIDEGTAIEVRGREAKVIGRSFVVLIQADKDGRVQMETLNHGKSFEIPTSRGENSSIQDLE